ncbi:MAG TPA: AmmeMemoRadiSam system protein B [Candidatus Omnitrophota bacterium]|nr:AmmeMemoRadiSam system protein B [Candidatus Omnitrophota bacterium]HPS19991.1 AmmeMemoRadiSam system protein B [Candidatus Omnitrophota bacterium]
MKAREPYVAGQFYPGDKNRLSEILSGYIVGKKDKIDAIGAVSPHAGYIYSGKVAGKLFGAIEPKDTYIVLSPNHTGYGACYSMSPRPWRTLLGVAQLDDEIARFIEEGTSLIVPDDEAHYYEHAVEVQLPFIQSVAPDAKIVAITMSHGDMAELREVAAAISGAIKKSKRSAMIIASSDMTHYEPRIAAKMKDDLAIREMLKLDAKGLIKVVEDNDITMCGYIPAAVMLMAACDLGAHEAKLVDYADSGDGTHDLSQVVGYAGVAVY